MEKKSVLCIAGALFGRPFISEASRLGWNVYLLTEEKYLKEAWEREYLTDVYAVPDLYDETTVRNVVGFLSRTIKFDKIDRVWLPTHEGNRAIVHNYFDPFANFAISAFQQIIIVDGKDQRNG